MEQLTADGHRPDVVFMDPPRSGSDQRFLSSLIKAAPKKIVYISCNIETQRRDLNVLIRGGYRVQRLQPVDMFPFTNHIENIALLVRNK
jgi:23S rRNA (uracil1939-C5)-methyltransferase